MLCHTLTLNIQKLIEMIHVYQTQTRAILLKVLNPPKACKSAMLIRQHIFRVGGIRRLHRAGVGLFARASSRESGPPTIIRTCATSIRLASLTHSGQRRSCENLHRLAAYLTSFSLCRPGFIATDLNSRRDCYRPQAPWLLRDSKLSICQPRACNR